MKYLYAAYAATWIIHGCYIATLVVRYRRVKAQLADLHAVRLNT